MFSTLLKMFALYPFNDIAHRYITNIISFALSEKIGKKFFDAGQPPKRVNKFLDLELINSDDKDQDKEEAASTEDSLNKEDDQTRRDQLLVHILFSTSLIELINTMCL